MAGKTNQFRSSKIQSNPPSQRLRKISIPSSAENFKENQAKIANLILEKYEEIGEILAVMIFKGLHN